MNKIEVGGNKPDDSDYDKLLLSYPFNEKNNNSSSCSDIDGFNFSRIDDTNIYKLWMGISDERNLQKVKEKNENQTDSDLDETKHGSYTISPQTLSLAKLTMSSVRFSSIFLNL
jgi:hypothetical protein